MPIRKYLIILAGSALLAVVLFTVGHAFALPVNYPVLATEITIAFFSGFFVAMSPQLTERLGKAPTRLLGAYLVLISFADLSWTVVYFLLKLPLKDPIASAVTATLYSSAFLSAVAAMILSARQSGRRFLLRPLTIVPLAVTASLATRLLLAPYFSVTGEADFRTFDIFQAILILGNASLLCVGVVTLLSSRNLFWTAVSGGMLCTILSGFATQFAALVIGAPQFSLLEYLWLFGIVSTTASLCFLRDDAVPLEPFDRSSLVGSYKLLTLGLAVFSILLVCLTRSGDNSIIPFVTIGSAVALLLTGIIGHLLADRVTNSSAFLIEMINRKLDSTSQPPTQRELPLELREIYHSLFERKLVEEREREKRAFVEKLAETRFETARQVAHDIRSPLTALEMVVSDLASMPENARILVKEASRRIKDIANTLLVANVAPEEISLDETIRPELIAVLVDQVVSEKRVQLRHRPEINLDSDVTAAYGLFSRVSASVMKRCLSNVIDNAVQALDDAGEIRLTVENEKGQVVIRIRDNGKGIPEHVLPELGNRGVSHGKTDGHGLGLHFVKNRLRDCQATFAIRSEVDKGTEVTFLLPQVQAPEWFVSEIRLNPSQQIIIADDDRSIHEIWDQKLTGRTITHVFSAKELTELVPTIKGNEQFLIDYEFLGETQTGLDLIENLDLSTQAILVTSHFEDPTIRTRIAALNVKMIPKGMVYLVPVVTR